MSQVSFQRSPSVLAKGWSPLTGTIALLLLVTSFLLHNTNELWALEIPEKHELDERSYRKFTLDNGLKVILVHDPKMNKSGCAMDVGVGSLSDPKEHQGLAHFLEHMLFLGTKKYPEEGEYSRFLKSRGGYSNAFTAGNHTNYHFMIHHDAFEGALDRFAQFFISPLFNPEFSNREIQAVHNEHQKNLLNDGWRQYYLLNRFFDPEHPAHHFGTGNAETLKNVDQTTLKTFYERYYSANQMALALASSQSLDWMEQQVKAKFSAVPNHNSPTITYPENYLQPSKEFRLIKVKPVKDLRELKLSFALPALDAHFESQPASIIGSIVGHEGQGSLLSYLKKENYATGLSAGPYKNTPQYASFSINVTLTKKGLEEVQKVASLCFSLIKKLQELPFPEYLFNELRTRQQLEKVFDNKAEGSGLCIELSSNLNRYPMEWVENLRYSLSKIDENIYRSVLEKLTPENCIAMIVSKTVDADLREPIYGTEYSFTKSKAWFQELSQAKPHDEISLPKANPFLPEKATVLPEAPTLILKSKGLELYHRQDTTFKRPKSTFIYEFRPSPSFFALEEATLLDLSVRCLNEQLNEHAYAASMAGAHFGLYLKKESIRLTLTGYSDALPKLLDKALESLTQLHLSPERFQALKSKQSLDLANFEHEDAWKHARLIARKYRQKTVHLPHEHWKVLQGIDAKKVAHFIENRLWSEHAVQGLAYGNLYAEQAISQSQKLLKALGIKALSLQDSFHQAYLNPEGGCQHEHFDQLQTNNACYRIDLKLDDDSPKMRMLSQVLGNFISEPFYSEMRTRQQLGYIVWSGAMANPLHHYLVFIIQSGTHSAAQVKERVHTFLPSLLEQTQKISDEQFTVLKSAIREQLLEKSKSIHESAEQLFQLTFEEDKTYDLKQQLLRALDELKKEDLFNTLQKALSEKSKVAISISLEAQKAASAEVAVQKAASAEAGIPKPASTEAAVQKAASAEAGGKQKQSITEPLPSGGNISTPVAASGNLSAQAQGAKSKKTQAKPKAKPQDFQSFKSKQIYSTKAQKS